MQPKVWTEVLFIRLNWLKVVFLKTFGYRICFYQPSQGVLTSNECYDKLGGCAIPQSTFPLIMCAFPLSCINRPNSIGFPTGGERFYDDMENMIGFRINPWLRWCWMIFTPIFCLVGENIYLSVSEFILSFIKKRNREGERQRIY